jgi:methionyl-tRNA formyltransferase
MRAGLIHGQDPVTPRVRTVFMGTAPLACPSLDALCSSSFGPPLAVVTQPDRPKGRSLRPQPTPIKQLALQRKLPVLQPLRAAEPDFIAQIAQLAPDLIVVAAYGQLLPPSLLELPRHGCVNIHTSLLPKYRGAAPIQWAILNGDPITGVTLMKIDAGLDTGDILATQPIPIQPDENAQQLHDRLACIGAQLLLQTLPDYLDGHIVPQPQDHTAASYARKLTRSDGQLDWRLPAPQLHNRIRALTPWPGSFTHLPASPHPVLLKVWKADLAHDQGEPGRILKTTADLIRVACGDAALDIRSLQREGGRQLTPREFLSGTPLHPGLQFLTLP